MTESLQGLIDRMADLFAAGLLSVFGGTAAYLYQIVKNDTGFKFSQFFINAFLAFFIGNMIGGFIPHGANYRDGLLMLAGFSTFPVLGVMEFYGKKVVLRYIDKSLGINATAAAEAEEKSVHNEKLAKEQAASGQTYQPYTPDTNAHPAAQDNSRPSPDSFVEDDPVVIQPSQPSGHRWET